MSINQIILFVLTLMFLSGLYKRIMIKSLRKAFLAQDEYTSFIDFGIDNSGFKPFRLIKFFKLIHIGNSNLYYKIMSKIYLFQVLISVLGYIALLIANYLDELGVLKIKL